MGNAIDSFTIIHLLLWALAATVARQRGASAGAVVVLGLVAGLTWEVIETGLEGIWGGRESFANRWVSDPAADCLGAWVGVLLHPKKRP